MTKCHGGQAEGGYILIIIYLNLTLLCYNCYGGAFINEDCALKHGNGKCILILIRTCFLSFSPQKNTEGLLSLNLNWLR